MVSRSEPVADAAAQLVPLSWLVPWANNPRINDDAAKTLADAMVRFGWTVSALVRREDHRILTGHTRRKAALLLPAMWSRESRVPAADRRRWHPDAVRLATQPDPAVPVRFVDGINDADADALSLADNKLGELADWSGDLGVIIRRLSLDHLPELGPFTLPGFTADELAVLTKPPDVDLDAAFGALPTSTPTHREITFQVTHEQFLVVSAAVKAANASGPYEGTGNENRNGNALQRIAEAFLRAVGASVDPADAAAPAPTRRVGKPRKKGPRT